MVAREHYVAQDAPSNNPADLEHEKYGERRREGEDDGEPLERGLKANRTYAGAEEQHAGTLHVDRGDDDAVDEPLHAEGDQERGSLERASPMRLRQEDLDGGDGGGDRRAVRRPDQSPDEGGAAERASDDAAVGGADDRPHQHEPPVEPHPARCRPSHSTKSTPPVRLTRPRWSDEDGLDDARARRDPGRRRMFRGENGCSPQRSAEAFRAF